MLRRLMPLIATLTAMLLDTSVIPVFYHGLYTVPLTLAVAMCIGLLNGRLRGLLFGMIGGILIDITAGSLPIMTFYFMSLGFLIALIIDEKTDRRIPGMLFHLRRGAVSFLLCLLGEIVFAVFQYFVTAEFEWASVNSIILRAALMAVMTMLLCPFLDRLFSGRKRAVKESGASKRHREVKHF